MNAARIVALLGLLAVAACVKEKSAAGTTAAASQQGFPPPDTIKASKQPIIGRDSVRQGPIKGLPTIADTAKRRPPD